MGGQLCFQAGDGNLTEMEDGRGQTCIDFRQRFEQLHKILHAARAAGGDDRHADHENQGAGENEGGSGTGADAGQSAPGGVP